MSIKIDYAILTVQSLHLRKPSGTWEEVEDLGGIAINPRGEILRNPTTLWGNGADCAISDLVTGPASGPQGESGTPAPGGGSPEAPQWSDFHMECPRKLIHFL